MGRRVIRRSLFGFIGMIPLLLPASAGADAVLQREGSSPENLFPVRIEQRVEARAQVETTTLVLDFDPLQQPGDFVLTVPGPEGAYIIGLDIDRGDGWTPAAMIDEAPPAGAGGGSAADPSLVAWVGHHALRADLPGVLEGPLAVRARFQRLLRRFDGAVAFTVGVLPCPLRSAGAAEPEVSLSFELRTSRPLESFEARGAEAGESTWAVNTASVDLAARPLGNGASLAILYQEAGTGIHGQALFHRTPSSDPLGSPDGYFLILLDADSVAVQNTLPRSLSLVVDRSGSMLGDKIDQARAASHAMLDNLRGTDLFNVHSFHDRTRSLFRRPQPASVGKIEDARAFVRDIEADGTTNLHDGLLVGLGCRCSTGIFGGGCRPPDAEPSLRYDAMVLLSDGMATAGYTEPRQIFDAVRENNVWSSRIYTVAVGEGADRPLLEAIARANRGKNFVLTDQQAATALEEVVRQLFEDIEAVRVTDLSVTLEGLSTRDQLPGLPPDLHNGGQVILVGRYTASGSPTLVVEGQSSVGPYERRLPLEAPEMEAENEFIKWVWATERVGALLAELGAGAEEGPIQAAVTELGLAYRIQTPYTSFTYSDPMGGDGMGSSAGMACGCSTGGLAPSALLWALLLLGLLPWRRRLQPGGDGVCVP